jgi:hypothetical protein
MEPEQIQEDYELEVATAAMTSLMIKVRADGIEYGRGQIHM